MKLISLKQKYSSLVLIALSALIAFSSILLTDIEVRAVSESELRNNISAIEDKIKKNEEALSDAENRAITLENQLWIIRTEIDTVNAQIDVTELKIQKIKLELKKTQKELDRQENILNESVRELYKNGSVTTIEMLASSESISDYFAQEEYLERLKSGVEDSVAQVKVLKEELEEKRTEQESLLVEQERNKATLAERESAKADILEKTRGEEAKFQKIVKDLENQRQQAEQELNDYLASLATTGNYVSLGRVQQGDVIGYVGSTGFSFGPHLHFEMRSGANHIDPLEGGSLRYGWQFPLVNTGYGDITQYYGCGAPYSWYITKCSNGTSFHSGLDVGGSWNDPVVAPAAGDIIFRDWWGGYGNMVLIQHDNGIITAYGHLAN